MAKEQIIEQTLKKQRIDKPAIGNKDGKLVRQNEIAEIYGVTCKTVDDWAKLGCPYVPHPSGGKLFYTGKVGGWYMNWYLEKYKDKLVEAAPEIESKMEAFEADRRKKVAEAMLAELKLAKERELVANFQDLAVNFGEACANIRAGLISWSSLLPARLAHKSENHIRKKIEKEVGDILENLTKYKHEWLNAEVDEDDEG